MSCVNKSTREYKILKTKFSDSAAESIVRSYTNFKNSSSFIIPTVREALSHIQYSKAGQVERVREMILSNDYTKENILRNLRGIIAPLNGTVYITQGNTDTATMTVEQRTLIFQPNYLKMKELAEEFPNVFSIRDTNNSFVKIVDINATMEFFEPVEEKTITKEDGGLKKTNPYAVNPGAKARTSWGNESIEEANFDSYFPDYKDLSVDEKENFLRGMNNDDINFTCII